MQRRNTRSFLTIFYLLIVLFLAILYVQGNVINSPDALSPIEATTYSSAEETPLMLSQSLIFNADNLLIILAAATVFFGSALVLEKSR